MQHTTCHTGRRGGDTRDTSERAADHGEDCDQCSSHLLGHVLWRWRHTTLLHHRRRHHAWHALRHVPRRGRWGDETSLRVVDRDAWWRWRHAHRDTLRWRHALHGRWGHGWHSLWDCLWHDRLLRRESCGRRWGSGGQGAGELTLIWTLIPRHGRASTECTHRRGGWSGGDRQRIILPRLGGK